MIAWCSRQCISMWILRSGKCNSFRPGIRSDAASFHACQTRLPSPSKTESEKCDLKRREEMSATEKSFGIKLGRTFRRISSRLFFCLVWTEEFKLNGSSKLFSIFTEATTLLTKAGAIYRSSQGSCLTGWPKSLAQTYLFKGCHHPGGSFIYWAHVPSLTSKANVQSTITSQTWIDIV